MQKELACLKLLLGGAGETDVLPLIVPLHFMGSNPEQAVDMLLGDFNHPSRVIAPVGQYECAEGQSWFPEKVYDESLEDQGEFCHRITKNLLANVENWKKEFPTRGKPIFVGVSQGGDMCFTLAARYADQFMASIPVAGRLMMAVANEIKTEKRGIVRVHHGASDPIVAIKSARQAVKQLLTVNYDVELCEYKGVGHAVPAEMRTNIQDEIYAVLRE